MGKFYLSKFNMNMKLLPVLAATMRAIILSSCSYGRTYTSYKAPLALRAYKIEERDTYVYYPSLPALRVYEVERRRAARDYEAQRLRAAIAYEAERRRASRIYEAERRRAARQSYTFSNYGDYTYSPRSHSYYGYRYRRYSNTHGDYNYYGQVVPSPPACCQSPAQDALSQVEPQGSWNYYSRDTANQVEPQGPWNFY
jgi:hypothetical protein